MAQNDSASKVAAAENVENSLAAAPQTIRSDVPQYGVAKLIVLHLVPGALATLVYLAWIPLARRMHFPAMTALLVSGAIGLVPIELGHLFLQGKKLNRRWSLEGVVVYRRGSGGGRYFLIALGLCVLAILGYELFLPLDRVWRQLVFPWLPAWYVYSNLEQYAQFSRSLLIGVFSARLLLDGFVFPIVEELYFRGYLLPRMSRFGWAAPFFNCALFSIYHFWQPFNLPTIFIVSLPMAIGVWITKNVRVGMYTHILLNTIGGIFALIQVLHLK